MEKQEMIEKQGFSVSGSWEWKKKQDGREEERRETVQFLWPAWVSVSESGYEGGWATPTSSDRIKET